MVTGSYIINGLSGIWNSYGCPPEQGEGLIFSIENSEDYESLIDLVGFEEDKKDLGVIADSKVIHELVVMLPMIEQPIDYIDAPESDPTFEEPEKCAPCDEKNVCAEELPNYDGLEYRNFKNYSNNTWVEDAQSLSGIFSKEYSNVQLFNESGDLINAQEGPKTTLETTRPTKYCITENAHLFTIDEGIINKILNVENFRNVSFKKIKEILETRKGLNEKNNIVKLMKSMLKYNFPPHLNWLLFKNLPTYVMYAVEFTSTLSKNDLSNIWQGTMPKLAEVPEEEEIIIEHYLNDEEIFAGYKISEIDNVQLKIFKCKLRASSNYESLKKNYKERYKTQWYNYNWPYDNFSLVELLKIEGGEVRDYLDDSYGKGVTEVYGETYNSDGSTSVKRETSVNWGSRKIPPEEKTKENNNIQNTYKADRKIRG